MVLLSEQTQSTRQLYKAVNRAVFDCIPIKAKNILDIGCGTGALGTVLKQLREVRVTGVTYSAAEAAIAQESLDDVWVMDLNQPQLEAVNLAQFDCVICSHILEHLYEPQSFLVALSAQLNPESQLVVALPNTLNWRQRLRFLSGSFRYTDGGLMDRTHFRFFDWDTAYELMTEGEFAVEERIADGYFPLPGLRKLFQAGVEQCDRWMLRVAPGLFSTQFVFTARPRGTEATQTARTIFRSKDQ